MQRKVIIGCDSEGCVLEVLSDCGPAQCRPHRGGVSNGRVPYRSNEPTRSRIAATGVAGAVLRNYMAIPRY